MTDGWDRRTFLRAAGLAGVTVGAAPLVPSWVAAAHAATTDGVFGFGVASGDPVADAVVLWTRVTPSPEATPGSGVGPPVAVRWELAADEAFSRVVRSGTVTTDAGRDHTVHVDVSGLTPYTRYWYRFSALGGTSPVGRTQTAPDLPGRTTALRMALVSCSNYTGGYFTAYRYVAQRDDLDLVLHLGDYIYEYGNDADRYGPPELRGVRDHVPPTEMVTLADYRLRFAGYRADPDLAEAHRRHPWVVVLDDHEVTNDAWRDGAENHDPDDDPETPAVDPEGSFAVRKAVARHAYAEWLPIRLPDPSDPQRLYRRFTYGTLADLHVIDTRAYRDEQVAATDPALDDPARELLGPAQRTWLFDGLRSGEASHQWRLLGNQTVVAPVKTPPLPADLTALPGIAGLLPAEGAPFNPDQWDGYPAERARVEALVTDAGIDGLVVLTGDIHSSWANDLPSDSGTYVPGAGPSYGVEFVTTSITSDNVDEIVESAGGTREQGDAAAVGLSAAVRGSNRHVRFLDFEKHGYAVLDVTPQRVQTDWFWLRSDEHGDPRLDPQAEQYLGASWQSLAGSQRVSPAGGPLGQRSDEPRAAAQSPSPSPSASTAAPAPTAGGSGGGPTGRPTTPAPRRGGAPAGSTAQAAPGRVLAETGATGGGLLAGVGLAVGGLLALRRRGATGQDGETP